MGVMLVGSGLLMYAKKKSYLKAELSDSSQAGFSEM